MTYVIRDATDADGSGLARLIAGVFTEYENCWFEPHEFPELQAVATHYARKDGRVWVVTDRDEIVGSLAVFRSPAPASFELGKVYLRKDMRGRGLASDLLQRARRHAARHGARRIELFTDTRFLDGHRFYERHGFRRLPGIRFLADVSDTWEFHYEGDLDAASI